MNSLNSDLAVVDRFTVQAETTADDVINWIKSFGSGKKAINLFQTEHDLMFGEAGNFYILLARNAIAEEITGIAINNWNQHTFSFKYDNAFSYSRLISNADIKKKNVSGSVTNYGNISLQLTTPSIVLGTRIIGNTGINSFPFTNGTVWYAYMVRNTAGTTINFVESGTEVEVEVYYIDQ